VLGMKILFIVLIVLGTCSVVFTIENNIEQLSDSRLTDTHKGVIYMEILCLPGVLILFLLGVGLLYYLKPDYYPLPLYCILAAIVIYGFVSGVCKIVKIKGE